MRWVIQGAGSPHSNPDSTRIPPNVSSKTLVFFHAVNGRPAAFREASIHEHAAQAEARLHPLRDKPTPHNEAAWSGDIIGLRELYHAICIA